MADTSSTIFKHINADVKCKTMFLHDSFTIIDEASTKYELNVKERIHIKWLRLNLNKLNNMK